uniref:pathogenesis-related homeodomain protein n=1 Tax=Erigeron canadensis TaxID=72917 RepID=UPI001CB94D48|nr:pathogenesis-related homeodomain protein [Erigeron canadensis]XP_043630597.1 pathogenesis-related homeodomain protein [Erigeron canadensis]XP_043630598.1 pathogenesis-related homeodomain protein [Erigeron canadensis]
MGDSSHQELIQNGSNLASIQTVSELNHDVNSNGACDEKVLGNHTSMENYNSIKGGSPIPDGLEATQGNGTNEVSTPVKRSRGRPRKTERKIVGSPRVLRSRTQEKPKSPEPVEAPLQETESKEKKRRKKVKKIKKDHNDEFSKIIRHLRYLIHRMVYEQNFIEAYAGEGWKGQSLEKLRPEKELERAKSDINRYKLKIRDLFQRIDKSCEEGRIPESLYDSEGLIDSEDIFCAKCGQTEVRLDNDIILCDGACERGFHQFCLDPPLLKEQVPPGDEGWLCPACDCKVDCFDMLNDSQGTNLSVTDSWEKVFPETATFGNRLDDNSGLPSDDSGDDDYDPDGPEIEEEADAEEDSSSDESDSSFVSEDLGAVANNDPLLGLPSDDSEDDDFNPDKVDSDKGAKAISSSSDFTSDFDDLGDINKNEVTSDEVQESVVPATEEEIPKTNMEDDDCGPITAKRCVERLDYKKLHDETYGNVSSDTSDEDFSDSEAPRRWKNANGAKGMKVNEKMEQNESTPVLITRKKLDAEGTSSSPAIKGSSDKSGSRPSYKRLGQAVTQRLYESFQENQYPDVDVRENLGKELNLTQNQVRKWFENARWSFNHHGKYSNAGKLPAEATENVIPKVVNVSSSNTKSRKRKSNVDQHDNETTPSLKEASPMDSSNQTTRRSGRVQAKKLTSVP